MKSKVVSFTAALIIAFANAGIVSYADSTAEVNDAGTAAAAVNVESTDETSSAAETVVTAVEIPAETTTDTNSPEISSFSEDESSLSDSGNYVSDSSAIDSSSDDNSSENENEQIKSDVSGYTTEDLIKIMTDFTSENAGSVTINKNGEVFITERDTPDYDNDSYYDTKGNASLIKSEQIIYNSTDMQFIAVTTKDGHVFYVLINYSARDGQDNVYFLNKVDDYDLYALLYAGTGEDGADPDFTPRDALNAAENLNGNNTKTRKASSAKSETSDDEQADDEYSEDESEETENEQSKPNTLPIIVGIAAVGVIGFYAYKNVIKKGGSKKKTSGFDDNDFDDDLDGDE